jgi:capsular exopolysaccharide synthesis family protein
MGKLSILSIVTELAMQSTRADQDSVNVQQYWQILRRRWLPASLLMGSVFALTTAFTLLQKPTYEGEGKLLFNKTSRVSSLTSLSEKAGELSGLTQLSNPLDTEAEVIRSQPLARKAIAELRLNDRQGEPLSIEEFLKKLKVKSVRGTDILGISYRSTDAKEAADVVNFLVQTYLENNIRNNRAEATAAREFITKQLPEVEARVSQTELLLRRFKEQNRVVALGEEAKVAVEGLKEISDEITKAKAEFADANSRSILLQGQLGFTASQATALTALSQSNSVQRVLLEYRQVQDKLAVERTRYTPSHPEIVNLRAKEEALRSQLNTRIAQTLGTPEAVPDQNLELGALRQTLTSDLLKVQAERQGLRDRVSVLTTALATDQKRADQLPRLEQQQGELQRQVEVARSTYEQLLKRLQEVQVIENQNVGNARIVSAASVPDKPVAPRILLNLLLGGFVGVMLGFMAALLLEAIDKSVKTVEEAKRFLDYPLLGTIPQLEQKPNKEIDSSVLPVRDNPHSPASAAFEMLETTLGFTLTDKSLKMITVTSALPTEGKSFVAANLAVATAQMGKRVLLIDADMRRPTQHHIWNLTNLKGLSDILVGQANSQTSAQEVLVNLDVLTAGTIPPNPMALLNSKQIADTLEEIRDEYDFIIIDTPPIALTADGLTLGKLADGVLLVIRPGVVNSDAIHTMTSLFSQASSHVLGIVANGITSKNESGSYYNRDRYYGNSPHTGKKGIKAVFK